MQKAWFTSAGNWATVGANLLDNPALPMGYFGMGPAAASALKVFAHLYEDRGKPDFNLEPVEVDGELKAISETVVLEKPFGGLRRFMRDDLPKDAPKLLIVAPMSGHFATLLRGTVHRMAQNHQVWITDWTDARLVPTEAGRFDLDDYIDYLIEFLQFLGPKTKIGL